jgi:acetyl esterase/lipase
VLIYLLKGLKHACAARFSINKNIMKENSRRNFIKTSSLGLGLMGTGSFSALALDKNNMDTQTPIEEIVINLWPDKSINNGADLAKRPKLTLYMPKSAAAKNRAAIVVCPGGGYGMLADHEGAPFAKMFAEKGMVSAVLTYRVAPNKFPAPYADAVRAMRIMRSRASSLGIDPNKIGIMGFSAGGHLASTVATQPDLYKDPQDDLAASVSAQSNRVILGYPVITFGEFTHAGSVKNLLGDNPDMALRKKFSSELHVTASTPPTFIFHTADDAAVPVQNALLFAEACINQKVPVALHIYPKGPHGVGMALDNPDLNGWTMVLLNWLRDWQDV